VARAIPRPDLRRLVPGRREWTRAFAAGLAFSMLLTAGLTAMAAWQCGVICPADIADNAMLSFAAGFLGLGPIAAYGRRNQPDASS
jgi:hypothetical protein